MKAFIQEGLLRPGPPPNGKRMTVKAWSDGYGMKFLYWSASENELEHWYYCEICGWINYVVLSGGTNSIKNHAETHVYSGPKSRLISLLSKAIEFGSACGTISKRTLDDHFPKSDKWYFIATINIYMKII